MTVPLASSVLHGPAPRRNLPWLRLLLVGAIAAAGGCGGGTAGSGGGDQATPAVGKDVLVLPVDDEQIGAIVATAGGTLVGEVEGTDWYRTHPPEGLSTDAYIARLESDARVVDADADLDLGAPEGEGSTIPFLGTELPMQITAQPELLRIGLARAHETSVGAGVRVAVLDTGVDPTHESLQGHLDLGAGWDFVAGDPDAREEANGIDDDGDGRIDEGFGHGTFVASLVLAVAPEATIVPFRVLDSDSLGTESGLAAAISRATTAGVDVINLSIGMKVGTDSVRQAVQRARAVGVAVVISAGNTASDDVGFPAALSDGYSVTAVTPDDRKAPFASYGSEVDLSAPGVEMLGAFPGGSGTAHWSGTSFSAAVVSGAYALVKAVEPTAAPDALFQRLQDRSANVDPQNPSFSGEMGKGRLDLEGALAP